MASAKKQYFTAEEANKRLPLVRAIVSDIVELYHDVHSRRERLVRMRQRPGARGASENSPHADEVRQMERDIDRDIERLQEFVEELNELGALLKDPITGLIDFYTRFDGQEAFLCWKLGEDEVAWWHDLESGFNGRQPLLAGAVAGDSELPEEESV